MYDFAFSGTDGSASFQITTCDLAGSYPGDGAQVTGISGNGNFTFTVSGPTTLTVAGAISGPDFTTSADNLLYSGPQYVDSNGIAFDISSYVLVLAYDQ
jgi:hypothetical protein